MKKHIASVHEEKKVYKDEKSTSDVFESNTEYRLNKKRSMKSHVNKAVQIRIKKSNQNYKINEKDMDQQTNGKKLHKCSICDKQFRDKCDVKRHIHSSLYIYMYMRICM